MNQSTDTNGEAQAELIKKHVRQLAEHFDSVQIFTNSHMGDGRGTRGFSYGSGSVYSRAGQCREWLIQQDEKAKIEVHQDLED